MQQFVVRLRRSLSFDFDASRTRQFASMYPCVPADSVVTVIITIAVSRAGFRLLVSRRRFSQLMAGIYFVYNKATAVATTTPAAIPQI